MSDRMTEEERARRNRRNEVIEKVVDSAEEVVDAGGLIGHGIGRVAVGAVHGIRAAATGVAEGVTSAVSAVGEGIGTVAGAIGDGAGMVAEGIGSAAEGAGGCLEGCMGCSAVVLFGFVGTAGLIGWAVTSWV